MEENLFQFIQDAVFKVTGKKGLFYDTDFVKDLQLSSFDVMNIVCIFEENELSYCHISMQKQKTGRSYPFGSAPCFL